MKKFFSALLLSGVFLSYAQKSEDNAIIEGHYLGLQVNELLKQLISFGSSTTASNPYFFNYSYFAESGGGVSMSFAYTADKISSSDNFGNDITTNINNVFFRVGYEKRQALSKRFVYGMAIDLILESQNNETENQDNFGSGSTVTTTNKLSGWGLGPRVTFHYQITERILVGSEANYYFKSLKNSFEVDFSDSSNNDDSDEEDVKRLRFSAPAILWLSFRF